MADKAKYSFLPWFRKGIIGLQHTADIPEKNPVSVPLKLEITPEGQALKKIDRQVKIFGPGDVVGIDQRMIVRTIPRAGVKTFEPNFLCAIEFYEEDFPWRYTPLKNKTLQLSPWIWLVALHRDEFTRLQATSGQLPIIEINGDAMATAFPDPSTTWAWAHTHLNFEVEGATITDKRNFVNGKLEENPALGCSRLICPRRLKPLTTYTAFLVPAFEKGRQAGIGADAAVIDNTPNAQASWSKNQTASQKFPVYFEWQFTTDTEGDFESLAKRLQPLSEEEMARLKAATKAMTINNPGWGLSHATPGRALQVESALKLLNVPDPVPITDINSGGTNAEVSSNDKTFVKSVSDLINLGVATYIQGGINNEQNPWFEDGTLDDDPIVAPPLYGAFYRNSAAPKTAPDSLFTQPPATHWYSQLNLNPVYRVGASQGTTVVQRDQDSLMDRAWDQREAGFAAQQLIHRWHYSAELSTNLVAKKIDPLISDGAADPGKTWTALSFVAPMNRFLNASGKNFNTAFQERTFANVFNGAFKRLISKNKNIKSRTGVNRNLKDVAINPGGAGGGVVVSRDAAASVNVNVNTNVAFFSSTAVMVYYVPAKVDPLLKSLTNIFNQLNLLLKAHMLAIRFGTDSPLEAKDTALKAMGYAGYTECKTAIGNLKTFFTPAAVPTPPIVFTDLFLYKQISSQVRPMTTITAKVKAVKGLSVDGTTEDWMKPPENGPQFPEPMFKPLAEISTDFILPGLSEIPVDRALVLGTNQAFIEAYMVGLNHEIAREFLWREFPAPLNGTPFRQFWDTRNVPKNASNQEQFKDIKIISSWGNNKIGANKPGGLGQDRVVLLIRGELFRKYPYTEVFMQQAEWVIPGVKRKPKPGGELIKPIFSAQINPDYYFIGFEKKEREAVGADGTPGYYFVLRERAGEIQFGLDKDLDPDSPSWVSIQTEVPEHSCINADLPKFRALQKTASLRTRSDGIASLLYQRPFSLFLHAARLIE